jgi:hypothetical protein
VEGWRHVAFWHNPDRPHVQYPAAIEARSSCADLPAGGPFMSAARRNVFAPQAFVGQRTKRGVLIVSSERAVQYRRRAEACLVMASTIESEERRASLVAMAQTWLRLAEEQAALPAAPEVPDRPQPAVQQQQQKQPEDDSGNG